MAKDYTTIAAIQQFDPTACWAASLEWWAKAIGNRAVITQLNLLPLYLAHWDSRDPDTNPDYGTVSRAGLIAIISDSRWRMDCFPISGSACTCVYLNQKMRHGPCLLGYWDTGVGGNHVVVAYGASETHVAVMDPNGARFRGRPVSVFTSREVIIGSPR